MRNFFNERSKILFALAIISLILFILCIPELLNYSKYLSYVGYVDAEFEMESLTLSSIFNIMITGFAGSMSVQFNCFVFSIIMIASFFNIFGFLLKKYNLNFISIGLYVVILCTSVYVFDILGLLLLIMLLILNTIAYIDQMRLNKKLKTN